MHIVVTQRLTMAHGVRGGMETQAHILSEGLIARGHNVVVLTTSHPDGNSEGYEGNIPVRYIRPGSYRSYNPQWMEACYDELTRIHQNKPVDVLLSQCEGSLGYLPRAVVDLKIPAVVVIHGSIAGEIRTRLRSLDSLRGFYRLLRHLYRQPRFVLLWRKAAPMVDRWVVVSYETARQWQREMGIAADRITVVRNGIDTTLFRPDREARMAVRAQLGIAEHAPVLIAVGRLEYEKGFHIAVKAFKALLPRFPDMRLLIAGEGIYQHTLERMAKEAGDAVAFLGYVPNQRIAGLLAASDLFVMPTLRDEGLPMNVIEALSTGLPVIASRAGGLPSAVAHGVTGLLLPMGNVEALTQAVEQLLLDQALRTAMAKAAREAALAHFSHRHMVNATEQVLMEVAAVRRR